MSTVTYWNPTVTPLDAILGFLLIFGILFLLSITAMFYLRATRPVLREVHKALGAANGAGMPIRNTEAVRHARREMERAVRKAGWR